MNYCTTPAQARELGRLQALLGAEQEKSKGLQEKIERCITAYDEGARKLLALEISDASLRSLQEEQAKALFRVSWFELLGRSSTRRTRRSSGSRIMQHRRAHCFSRGPMLQNSGQVVVAKDAQTKRTRNPFQRLVHWFCAVWFSFSLLLGQIMESKDKHISWLQNQIEKVQEPTEKALHPRLLQSHILHVFFFDRQRKPANKRRRSHSSQRPRIFFHTALLSDLLRFS